MKKKTERIHRLVRKLSAKYGNQDADVIRLQEELNTLVEMEKYDGNDQSAARAALTGPSLAKKMYLEALRAAQK